MWASPYTSAGASTSRDDLNPAPPYPSRRDSRAISSARARTYGGIAISTASSPPVFTLSISPVSPYAESLVRSTVSAVEGEDERRLWKQREYPSGHRWLPSRSTTSPPSRRSS